MMETLPPLASKSELRDKKFEYILLSSFRRAA